MRSIAAAVSVILMTIGLAVVGWVNPTLGSVCLFGGAALWIVCQKKTILVIERAFASKSRRAVLDEQSAKKKHIREQFAGLSVAEKEAGRHVKLNGYILPQQVASHLASQGSPIPTALLIKYAARHHFYLGASQENSA
jgi:hypothetical protein